MFLQTPPTRILGGLGVHNDVGRSDTSPPDRIGAVFFEFIPISSEIFLLDKRLNFEVAQSPQCVVTGGLFMKFEFDDKKSNSNKIKHGIDFIEAQALWDDPDIVEIPAKVIDEPRFMVVAKIGTKHWSGIIGYRGDMILYES